VASHGYAHVRATQQTPSSSVPTCPIPATLEIRAGNVKGFAPRASIGAGNLWRWMCWVRLATAIARASTLSATICTECLKPAFSLSPTAPGSSRFRSQRQRARHNLRAGSGYFRLLPYAFYRWALLRVNRASYSPVSLLPPWEFDPTNRARPASV